MKLLGIDYGKKRIGIARGNDKEKIALPLTVVKNNQKLKDVIQQEKPNQLIVGLPLNSKGKLTKQAKEIKKQVKKLNFSNIEFVDESFTTKTAQGDKDLSAARQILQEYLDMVK